jgi:alpha-L-arabinofuranosidase
VISWIATVSEDRKRLVIKAVNYSSKSNKLFVRLQGKGLPSRANVMLYSIEATQNSAASFEHSSVFVPVSRPMEYAKDLSVELDPYSVMEIQGE